jgi:tetratricopeptide (TPR) repeat protein
VPSSPTTATTESVSGPFRYWLPLLLVALVGLAWSNTLHAPFVLDDHSSVVGNTSIREFAPLRWLLPPASAGETVSGRPVLNLSFALNYACGGLAPFGYHVANLAIHAVATMLLFGTVRRTLALRGCGGGGLAGTMLAGGAAACWALHPLQTAAVTYVSQRAESLAGMFLLLMLYCVSRAVSADGRRGRVWGAAAVVACALGMATKETMVVAPVLALLYDRAFGAGTVAGAVKRRWWLHGALAACWSVLAFLVWNNPGRGGSAGFGAAVDPWTYLQTQAVAIPHYLRLAFWPTGQVFDYGVVAVGSWTQALPGLLMLGVAGVAALWALSRNRVEGFLGVAFYLLLAPSSSIVPVATQTIAEHRMYLPLAAVVLLVATFIARMAVARRWPGMFACVVAGVALILGGLAWQRNEVYRSDLSLWQDTVAKRPDNPRARNNLGVALAAAGREAEAIEQYDRCIELQPMHAYAHSNLGALLLSSGRHVEAEAHLRAACAADPNLVDARFNLGQTLARLGREDEAAEQYRVTLKLDPSACDAALNLGALLVGRNRLEEAEPLLRRALELAPGVPENHYHLGRLYERRGDSHRAEACYREAIRLRPGFAAAHLALGNCLAVRGDAAAAEASVREALRLDGSLAEAHFSHGNILARKRLYADAEAAYAEALRLDPVHVQARTNLGNCQLVTGRLREAIATYEEVLRLRPGEPTALRNLALAREYLGE